MANRDRPYPQFNFSVDLGSGGPAMGFSEIAGLGIDVHVAEYREGNAKFFSPQKITTINKISDVTLKRGVADTVQLWTWLTKVRSGDLTAIGTVIISLLNETGQGDPVMQWKLVGARPIKYTGPNLSGNGAEIAIEELVLAVEQIEVAQKF